MQPFAVLSTLAFAILLTLTTNITYARDVAVRGYVKSNGTYVAPHMRSAPDGNPYNNWSFPGNTNPYTGKVATGDPNKRLQDYYRQQAHSSASSPSFNRTSPTLAPHVVDSTVVTANSASAPMTTHTEWTQRQRYCERSLGSSRTRALDCQSAQPAMLAEHERPPEDVKDSEWQAAVNYCKWLYGDNRAGAYGCERMQAHALDEARRLGLMGAQIDPQRRGECEQLHQNNRAGFWRCVALRH
jgi:hypothetical protein